MRSFFLFLSLSLSLFTQEAMAPSRYDWKIVDWDVKPQHNQPTNSLSLSLSTIKYKIADTFFFVICVNKAA